MSTEEYPDYSKTFSLEKVIDQARWFHEDLEKSGGWRIIHEKENKSKFWIKTFPDEEVPTKVLVDFHLPLSAQQFIEVLHPKNMEKRLKWDKSFFSNEVLEEYPDGGGYLLYNIVHTPWPMTDRDFLLFTTAAHEIEWNGKRAYIIPYSNGSHKSKPANVGPYIRLTNGGQFSLVMEDERDPAHWCKIFGLSNNLYNGWIPKNHAEFLFARTVPRTFTKFYDDVVEGYKTYFVDMDEKNENV